MPSDNVVRPIGLPYEMAERGGFEPPVRFYPYNGLANRFVAFLGVVTESPISCFSALKNKFLLQENKIQASGLRIHTLRAIPSWKAKIGDA